MNLSKHSTFIILFTVILLLTAFITGVGIRTINTTGYTILASDYCEPLTCKTIGLKSTGKFYCDTNKCYRDCYNGENIIEMATFCIKANSLNK